MEVYRANRKTQIVMRGTLEANDMSKRDGDKEGDKFWLTCELVKTCKAYSRGLMNVTENIF